MSDRPRRKRKQNNRTVASNVHYVGYVEDEESVEAIMKKFEELDRIQHEFSAMAVAKPESSTPVPVIETADDATPGSSASIQGMEQDAIITEDAPESGMTEEQLQEIFKRTSSFTVKSATMEALTLDDMDAMELWQVEVMQGNTEEFYEEDDYVYADDDFWDLEFGEATRKRSRRQSAGERRMRIRGEGRTDREKILARYKIMQVQVQDQNGIFRMVKKRVCDIDPSLPLYIRIPGPPIPPSWARAIMEMEITKSVNPPAGSRSLQVPDILGTDLTTFGNKFSAVYMDPPLLLPGEEPSPGKISIDDLSRLNVSEVVQSGFLFIWTEKEWIREMVRITKDWGFKYVENFCWVKKNVNNQIMRKPYDYFSKSKLTLLIFRKDGDIELRHQRNPDCMFDFVKPILPGEVTEPKPEFLYTVIETLLPQAVYHPETNPNGDRLMELWAKRGQERTGWTTLVEKPQL